MHQGRIFATGKPEEVITEDNLRTVYGVNTRIITEDGMPHVILKDSIPMDLEDIDSVRSPLMAESLKNQNENADSSDDEKATAKCL